MAELEWLTSLYPEIRRAVDVAFPRHWPELRSLIEEVLAGPPLLHSAAILPPACCQAVGGRARDAVPAAAALIIAALCVRILDDLEDKDRPDQLWRKVGEARAWNFASAVQVLAFDVLSKAGLPAPVFQRVNQVFIDAFVRIAQGQDRDLAGLPPTIEDYWLTIEMKTAAAYSAACAVGALIGTDNPQHVQACNLFGHHAGLAIQIFNDLESIWEPDGVSDLRQGKVTLPLMYGLCVDHPARAELHRIVASNDVAAQAGRIRQILESIDTRAFLVWAALKQREEALNAIAILPDEGGREALDAYITGMFGDVDELIRQTRDHLAVDEGEPLPDLSLPSAVPIAAIRPAREPGDGAISESARPDVRPPSTDADRRSAALPASGVLEELLGSSTAPEIRLGAATALLEHEARRRDRQDLERRVAALEARLAGLEAGQRTAG